MRNKVSNLETIPFIGITANTLSKNTFEQNVVKDYVAKKKFNHNQFRDDILAKCEAAGDWEIEDGLGNNQTIRKNSSLCRNCVNNIWDIMIYNYRRAINNELPANVQNRSDCWYGKNCRTQIHKYSHASKLNHVCEARK